MKLQFTGIGSAFNTKLGNTSAYFKKQDDMLLIDCGSLVFHELMDRALLEDLKALHVVITHTHPDHVASLAEVIFYCYYIRKITVKVIFKDEQIIRTLLKIMGAKDEMYELITDERAWIISEALGTIQIQLLPVSHTDTLNAYSLLIKDQEECIYYSGDSNQITDEILERFEKREISRIYQDTCGIDYPGNVHYYIGYLEKRIKPELRNNVYCMHLDSHINEQQIKDKGFKVVVRAEHIKI